MQNFDEKSMNRNFKNISHKQGCDDSKQTIIKFIKQCIQRLDLRRSWGYSKKFEVGFNIFKLLSIIPHHNKIREKIR